MSKTPRTDAELKLEAFMDGFGIVDTVQVEFAAQLETELNEARADADHWKSECSALQRMAHEARAEIERLALEIENKQYTITCESEENQQLKESLAEARAEIDHKDRLIESLKNCQNCGRGGGFCRHCKYAPEKRGRDDNWKEPV